ncbi:hypothetical protein [uncultured Sulfitobacter sp.]|uniref:hypothetical protein n=1 Tax=uncultured Sulfitobacter sp. TaxID=191468 RepID=UPI0030F8BE0A
MIKPLSLVAVLGMALSACQPAIPDSGRGAGFDDFQAEQAQRDAALAASTQGSLPAPSAVTATALSAPDDGSAAATAAETARVLDATRPGGLGNDATTNSGVAPINASPANAAPPVLNSDGISQENNFDAVAGERTIEGDAARIAANRAQYRVVEPEALPDRIDAGPNIVSYALQTKHSVGTTIYTRRGLNKERKYTRACAEYSHPDQAQIAFLSAGGPERDRAGMDPDGDGYACDWDPSPYRRAIKG